MDCASDEAFGALLPVSKVLSLAALPPDGSLTGSDSGSHERLGKLRFGGHLHW